MQAQQNLADARRRYLAGLASNLTGGDEATTADLEAEMHQAEANLEALYVDVVLQALEPGDFEALVDAHTDADGGIDRAAFLPEALAASAADESLQDEDWWREQLATPRWTDGERSILFATVSALNDPSVRAAAVPKG